MYFWKEQICDCNFKWKITLTTAAVEASTVNEVNYWPFLTIFQDSFFNLDVQKQTVFAELGEISSTFIWVVN